jgi:hypothetical protein
MPERAATAPATARRQSELVRICDQMMRGATTARTMLMMRSTRSRAARTSDVVRENSLASSVRRRA